ncbi:MAG: glycosyltransferase family 4 protein [Holosporaceae bacterium]|nr:glycosyltransferase family 4 protein [Holosporaceae bacterium]
MKWIKVLSFLIVFPISVLLALILMSDAKFSDFFVSRISLLENRASNITRDIVVDTICISDHGGIKILTENLIKLMAIKRPNWRFIVILGHKHCQFSKLLHLNNVIFVSLSSPQNNGISLFLRNLINILTLGLCRDKVIQLCCYNTLCFDDKCDLFFDPYAEMQPNDFSLPKISIIHDLAYVDIPDCNTPEFCSWLAKIGYLIIKSSSKIITISNFSKQRIMQRYNLSTDEVKMIYNCLVNRITFHPTANFINSCLGKYDLEKGNYLIYVSSFWRHKNHPRLIEAFSTFLSHSGSKVKLAIVGTFDIERHPDFYKSLLAERGLHGKVICTHHVDEKELDVLLRNALAMVFPSRYEGFGMPVVEAMSMGIPVACSNVASLPEICGDAALFFDPYDTNDMAAAIEKIVSDAELRKTLIQRGYDRAKQFADPNVMVDDYIRAFEEVMEARDTVR